MAGGCTAGDLKMHQQERRRSWAAACRWSHFAARGRRLSKNGTGHVWPALDRLRTFNPGFEIPRNRGPFALGQRSWPVRPTDPALLPAAARKLMPGGDAG